MGKGVRQISIKAQVDLCFFLAALGFFRSTMIENIRVHKNFYRVTPGFKLVLRIFLIYSQVFGWLQQQFHWLLQTLQWLFATITVLLQSLQ